jgi:hypothetical protein
MAERLDERWDDVAPIIPGFKKSWFLDYVNFIAAYQPEVMPPGALKRQLDEISGRALQLMMAMQDLEDPMRSRLAFNRLEAELRRVREKSDKFRPDKTARSGGSRQKRSDRVIKRLAAMLAVEILARTDVNIRPTLTLTGHWVKLTEILVEIAIGRSPGDVSRVCADCLKELRNEGFLSQRARRN